MKEQNVFEQPEVKVNTPLMDESELSHLGAKIGTELLHYDFNSAEYSTLYTAFQCIYDYTKRRNER